MKIKFELEPDISEAVTPIGIANALTKCPQLDVYDIDEIAMYLRVYVDSALRIKPCYGEVCDDSEWAANTWEV